MAKPPIRPAKLSRPRMFQPVARERLFARLDALRQSGLIWVCGPPGSGKTSLVSSWIDARKRPLAWYQVDSGDSDAATSFAFLVDLGRRARPRGRPLPYLTPDQAGDLRTFSRTFFRELHQRFAPGTVLVFDNCHEAPVPSFHVILGQAAEQLPEGMSLVAISREQPPQELLRLIANRTLGVLGWEEIRLDYEEAEAIVKRTGAPEALADALVRHADGWAAGLILLAASARRGGRGGTSHCLTTREELFAYFAAEVFATASSVHQGILMRTALLPEVSPASAIALSGERSAPELLEELYRRQYFTDRRTDPQPVYRYHDLFREFLVARAEQTYAKAEWRALVRHAANHMADARAFGPAIELYARIDAWDEIERTVLQHAPQLLREGRSRTLLAWLRLLPERMVEREPWLLYWVGMGQQVDDVLAARGVFERAVRLFAERAEREGEALAISAVVDGYFQEWNTVVTLDPWLDALLRLLGESASTLSSECLTRARTSLLIGLLFRRPGEPALRSCVEAITESFVGEEDPSERLRMMVYLVLYHDLMGNFTAVRDLIARLRPSIGDRRVAPRLRVWAIFRIAHHYMNAGEDRLALEEMESALRVSREEGVHALLAFLHIGHAMVLLNAGRPGRARDVLPRAASLLKASRPMEVVFYKWTEFSIAMASGDYSQAALLWDAFAKMPLIGVAHNLPYNHGTILLLVSRGETASALERIAIWRAALAGMGSACLDYNLDLMEAYVHLKCGDARAVEVLRLAFNTAAERGFYGTLCWLPALIAPLCALALREGIEPAFVGNLVLRKRLPAPEGALEWVWPVSVRALGGFSVLRNGEPIRFARRPQRRPLALLQAIIAAGEGGVSTGQLVALLWPDAEADAGQNALNAALHRLRRLLGDEASVRVTVGRVSINPESCWVDALAFDRAATRALSGQAPSEHPEEILRLYRGHFLGDDVDSPWAISYRDRLRAKFQRLTATTGARLEQRGEWRRAAMLYRGALEVDNLQEESYRRLMLCLHELGESAEAKKVYRRCTELLSIVLGTSPSPETVSVFQSLAS